MGHYRYWLGGAAAFVLALQGAEPAFAADAAHVQGWTVSRQDSMTCVATPVGQDSIGVVAFGPMFELLISSPDFPRDKASYEVSLAFDGKPPVQAVALGDGGVMEVRLGRGEPARTVAAASRVSVTVAGRTRTFSLRNAAAALDAAARCAGQPVLAQQSDLPPKSIPGAGHWTISEKFPGVSAKACSARAAGDQIDTILMINDVGELLLIGGHPDWATFGGDVPLKLSIDGGEPVALTASTIENLIMVRVTDPALLQRLRSAKTLDWTIPTGHVRGEVAGLGVALDAVARCRAEASKP